MNCGLLNDNHKHSPHQRNHIEGFHYVFWLAFELVLQVRIDFPKMFLQQRVSSHVRSLIFVSVRHAWKLDAASFWSESPSANSLHFVLCDPNLADLVFRVSQDDLMHSNSSLWESLPQICKTKFNVGFDLATILSSCSLLHSFRHRFGAACWAREFHLSHVKLPFVSVPASCFLVSMYLIWIIGSKLIRSNSQSRATLWVLETCLIVRLLPFIIILITASLSSNTYNKASWCENWTFEGITSTLSKTLITLWDCFRLCIVRGGEQASRFFNNGSPRSIMVLMRVSKNWHDQIL